jgi:hypothetical protein
MDRRTFLRGLLASGAGAPLARMGDGVALTSMVHPLGFGALPDDISDAAVMSVDTAYSHVWQRAFRLWHENGEIVWRFIPDKDFYESDRPEG